MRKRQDRTAAVTEIVGANEAQKRAHRSFERAALQFAKLLGTILGGLGITLAAWIQRVLEHHGDKALADLAWYLAIALGFDALGLITLVLTALLDQRAANTFAGAINHNAARMLIAVQRTQAREMLSGDERSAKEFELIERDGDHARAAVRTEARANRIDSVSKWVGVVAWLCLVAAFVALATGIVVTLNRAR